jgi:hypothetical protein
VIGVWLCYFSEKESSLLTSSSLIAFTQTCSGNEGSSGNPERSSVNSHKSH